MNNNYTQYFVIYNYFNLVVQLNILFVQYANSDYTI